MDDLRYWLKGIDEAENKSILDWLAKFVENVPKFGKVSFVIHKGQIQKVETTQSIQVKVEPVNKTEGALINNETSE